jgi:hypothetical protein
LQRFVVLANQRSLSELEQQGLIKAFESSRSDAGTALEGSGELAQKV